MDEIIKILKERNALPSIHTIEEYNINYEKLEAKRKKQSDSHECCGHCEHDCCAHCEPDCCDCCHEGHEK